MLEAWLSLPVGVIVVSRVNIFSRQVFFRLVFFHWFLGVFMQEAVNLLVMPALPFSRSCCWFLKNRERFLVNK